MYSVQQCVRDLVCCECLPASPAGLRTAVGFPRRASWPQSTEAVGQSRDTRALSIRNGDRKVILFHRLALPTKISLRNLDRTH